MKKRLFARLVPCVALALALCIPADMGEQPDGYRPGRFRAV